MFSLPAKHTCQIPPDHGAEPLHPIYLIPAPSGISYESLHYPMPLDQYQVVPLVINTGKIPLINHAVQAPIQYFIPNSESQRTSESYDPVQRSSPSHQHRSASQQHVAKTYSNVQTENRLSIPAHNHYSPTTMYSETHVESQPASRYSYGYQIIDGNIGDPNDQRESRDNGNTSGDYNGSTRTQTVFEYTNMPNVDPVVHRQHSNEARQKNETNASTTGSNPTLVVASDTKTTKTELKNNNKNKTNNLETPNNVTNQNGNLTTLKP